MDDDFNSALALGALFELSRAINGARDRGVGGAAFEQAQTDGKALYLEDVDDSKEDDSKDGRIKEKKSICNV